MKSKAVIFAALMFALPACTSTETAKAPMAPAPAAEAPVAATPAVAPAAPAKDAMMASTEITGKIVRFECGDNCYLVIKPKSGEEVSGLCVAEACKPWNENVAIPKNLIGKTVKVTTGMDKQLDGSGNVMGEFLSFRTVVIGG
jgi:hypothetical protein